MEVETKASTYATIACIDHDGSLEIARDDDEHFTNCATRTSGKERDEVTRRENVQERACLCLLVKNDVISKKCL